MGRRGVVALVAVAGVALAACGGPAGSAPQTWQASPPGAVEAPGGQFTPIVQLPPGATPPRSSTPPGGSSGPSSSGSTTQPDPAVVATRLTAPTGLALLPDGTALVGERTTGRIVRVQPAAGQPVPTVRTLTGLDTSGDGGLLDLAISPSYAQDNLIYAYLTTPTDNRVVEFTLNGPVTPVLTGIPKGASGNTGRLLFGRDGSLYVGTGDAGNPALAADPRSRAGKVLRVTAIGDPAPGNPSAASPVWTRGHQVVDGLCAVPSTSAIYEVEAGRAGAEVNLLQAGGDYGSRRPAATLPAVDGGPGGCAVLSGRLWVTSLDGQALLAAALAPGGGLASARFVPVLTKKYGRLRTVVAAPDGALWLTTSNRDGHGRPVAADERVIRFVPSAAGGNNSPL